MDIGARLRTARETRGLSLDIVARTLRIQPRYLTAIEENDWRAIPPRPFGRGFVRAYALQLGENPDETVREFFAQFASPDTPLSAPERPHSLPGVGAPWPARQNSGAAIAMLACAVAGLVVFAAVRREPAREASKNDGVGTSGTAAPVASDTRGAVQADRRREQPEAVVTVDLEASRPSWVSATVDGRRVIYRTLQSGAHETLRGRESISLRVGDAGAIRWQVNGGPVTTMGPSGAVKSARVIPEPSPALPRQ